MQEAMNTKKLRNRRKSGAPDDADKARHYARQLADARGQE